MIDWNAVYDVTGGMLGGWLARAYYKPSDSWPRTMCLVFFIAAIWPVFAAAVVFDVLRERYLLLKRLKAARTRSISTEGGER